MLYQESLYTAWPPEVREIYERNAMNRNDYGNILLERYEDGMAVGMEKGMEKGVDKGIEIAVKKMAESGLDAAEMSQSESHPELAVFRFPVVLMWYFMLFTFTILAEI